jgi:hypothetical protein
VDWSANALRTFATEDRSCGFERFSLSTLLQTLQQAGMK